jgi:hypothetical protein
MKSIIEARNKPQTLGNKAKYIYEILKELNPGVFMSHLEVLYDIGQKTGDLYRNEPLKEGDFISSGGIRVIYRGLSGFDVLIDLGVQFP